MTTAFYISAIAERLDYARALQAQIPDATILLDDPPSGSSWNNYRRALRDGINRGADWIVSLDDDAQVCEDFPATLAMALDYAPADAQALNFYYRKLVRLPRAITFERRVFYANDKGKITVHRQRISEACGAWAKTTGPLHGIAFAVRKDFAPVVLDIDQRYVKPDYHSGDCRVLLAVTVANAPLYYSIPALVEHRHGLASRMTNTYGMPNDQRAAARFSMTPPKHWRREVSVQFSGCDIIGLLRQRDAFLIDPENHPYER